MKIPYRPPAGPATDGLTTTTTQPANRPSHPADRGKPGDARHKGKRPHTTTSQGRQGRHAGQVARRMGQRTRDSNAIRYRGYGSSRIPVTAFLGLPTPRTDLTNLGQPCCAAVRPRAPRTRQRLRRTGQDGQQSNARAMGPRQPGVRGGRHTHSLSHTSAHTHTQEIFTRAGGLRRWGASVALPPHERPKARHRRSCA